MKKFIIAAVISAVVSAHSFGADIRKDHSKGAAARRSNQARVYPYQPENTSAPYVANSIKANPNNPRIDRAEVYRNNPASAPKMYPEQVFVKGVISEFGVFYPLPAPRPTFKEDGVTPIKYYPVYYL